MIKRVSESPIVYKEGSVIGKKIAESDMLEYVHLSLGGESEIEAHVLNIDVDFFVISGEGGIVIDKVKHSIKSGDFLRVNKGSERGLFTGTKQELKVLVIKSK